MKRACLLVIVMCLALCGALRADSAQYEKADLAALVKLQAYDGDKQLATVDVLCVFKGDDTLETLRIVCEAKPAWDTAVIFVCPTDEAGVYQASIYGGLTLDETKDFEVERIVGWLTEAESFHQTVQADLDKRIVEYTARHGVLVAQSLQLQQQAAELSQEIAKLEAHNNLTDEQQKRLAEVETQCAELIDQAAACDEDARKHETEIELMKGHAAAAKRISANARQHLQNYQALLDTLRKREK